MEILEVGPKEYEQVINPPYHAFGTAAFTDLNKYKCNGVFYLLFREGKYRLGITGGIREKGFFSPFSAPFGGFLFVSKDVRIQYIEEAIELLKTWAAKRGFDSINIILPPVFYESNFISKQINCFLRADYSLSVIDLNYAYNLDNFDENYLRKIWYNARKNLKIALNSGLRFFECKTDEEKLTSYEIIRKNRESRAFPLRMTWEQVSETIHIIPCDFFLVLYKDREYVASAVVFHINDFVVQVIYWGDIPGYSEIKPMNFMAFKIFEFYKTTGKKIADIGPSTEDSLPNYGLCEFKESIGCGIDTKIKFTRKL